MDSGLEGLDLQSSPLTLDCLGADVYMGVGEGKEAAPFLGGLERPEWVAT